MSSDIALRVEGLGKKYTIRHKDHDHVTLAQAALHRIRHPRGATNREEFWALDDVSFEVPRGEVLGVIGHNGAGKSTLLKILSRITPPTKGRVEVFGRIGSLLEVGTGFHPELTGRENVYLNGSILGMKKKEIDRQFDAIVDFSGVEQFLDTPVKRYSSGMYVRLAFAVAAHLDTEILLLDEVLAVGDAEFRQKSLGKMSEVAGDGRTVVLVSHDLGAIAQMASTVVWLNGGAVRDAGSSSNVLSGYRRASGSDMAISRFRQVAQRSALAENRIEFVGGSVTLERGLLGGSLVLCLLIDVKDVGNDFRIGLRLETGTGAALGSAFTPDIGSTRVGRLGLTLAMNTPLIGPGTFRLSMSIAEAMQNRTYHDIDVAIGALEFMISGADPVVTMPPGWSETNGAFDLGPLVVRSAEMAAAGAGPLWVDGAR